jgi:hypothetical protein
MPACCQEKEKTQEATQFVVCFIPSTQVGVFNIYLAVIII